VRTVSHYSCRSNGHVFEIQHLLSGEQSSAHTSRLVFSADAQLDVTTEIKDHVEGDRVSVERHLPDACVSCNFVIVMHAWVRKIKRKKR
jgi:hypothetical protein